MISCSLVRNYYQSKRFVPYLPVNSSFYHFRFRCLDGDWKKVRTRITTLEKLKMKIIQLDGGDIYYSTARWLKPEKTGFKDGRGKGYVVADHLMIGNDFCPDFDPLITCLDDMELARRQAFKAYKLLKKHPRKYKIMYILFSGRGFQISYVVDERLPADPRKRYVKSLQNRKTYKKGLLTVKFDEGTTMNPLLVRRLPGTVNTKTGYVATIITEQQLSLPINKLLNNIPYVTRSKPGIPRKRKMTSTLRSINERFGGVAGLAPQTTPFYSNKVMGVTDRYVLVLEYDNDRYVNDVDFLQKHYKLGETIILLSDDRTWIITSQTFPHRRLCKIMSKTSALNKTQQERIGMTRIPIKDFDYEGVIPSDNPVKAASKAHGDFLSKYHDFKPWSVEGKEELSMMINHKE